MLKIRIIDIPPGELPEEIRKEWVGLEFPIAEDVFAGNIIQAGAWLGPPSNLGGYLVEVKVAIKTLNQKNPYVANYWKSSPFFKKIKWFLFKEKVYKVI